MNMWNFLTYSKIHISWDSSSHKRYRWYDVVNWHLCISRHVTFFKMFLITSLRQTLIFCFFTLPLPFRFCSLTYTHIYTDYLSIIPTHTAYLFVSSLFLESTPNVTSFSIMLLLLKSTLRLSHLLWVILLFLLVILCEIVNLLFNVDLAWRLVILLNLYLFCCYTFFTGNKAVL